MSIGKTLFLEIEEAWQQDHIEKNAAGLGEIAFSKEEAQDLKGGFEETAVLSVFIKSIFIILFYLRC